MAVPKRRHSNARSRKRRTHDKAQKVQIGYCPKCSSPVPNHTVCANCGYYMGRVVVEPTEA